MLITPVANVFAFLSCPMWNPIGPVRHVSRGAYRWLAENRFMYCLYMRKHGVRGWQIANYAHLRFSIDTYPPLYADKHFAPWEEVADPDDPKRYNLISSRGKQVIRHPAAYCAYKIRELTGKYPQRLTDKRFDSADWVEFLAEAGYRTIADRPRPRHHYVGVMPGEGEYGTVVWFGILGREIAPDDPESGEAGLPYTDSHSGYYIIPYDAADPEYGEADMDIFCTTYVNQTFQIIHIKQCDRYRVIWVQID